MAFVVTNIRKKGEPWGDSDDPNVTYYIDAKSDEDGAVQEDVPAYVSASTILEVGAKGDLKRSKKGKLYFKPGESNGQGNFKKAVAKADTPEGDYQRQVSLKWAQESFRSTVTTEDILNRAQEFEDWLALGTGGKVEFGGKPEDVQETDDSIPF